MNNLEVATFAGGCFWCTEAIFSNLKGVNKVTSGYSGGEVENPSYEQVSEGDTGHAEAIQIEFDPTVVKYTKLLEIFFKTHDPTSWDRQGSDVGPQYRSIVFYHTEEQRDLAENLIRNLDKENIFANKIVTEVKPFKNFYIAESYHQDFYKKNRDYSYCSVVINPKLEKLYQNFASDLKLQ